MTAIKKLYDAANVALDVIDDEVAKGFPEPDWAHQLRNAIAENESTRSTPDETDWQRFIRMYAQEIGPTPTAEQAMLLKYFKEAERIYQLMTQHIGSTAHGVSMT